MKTLSIEKMADQVMASLYPDHSLHLFRIFENKDTFYDRGKLNQVNTILVERGYIEELDTDNAPRYDEIPELETWHEDPEIRNRPLDIHETQESDSMIFWRIRLTVAGTWFHENGPKIAQKEIQETRNKGKVEKLDIISYN